MPSSRAAVTVSKILRGTKFRSLKCRPQWCKIEIRQGIDNKVVVVAGVDRRRHTHLKQAELLPIRMQAIRFGIDSHALGQFDFLEQLGQLGAS